MDTQSATGHGQLGSAGRNGKQENRADLENTEAGKEVKQAQ